MSFDLFYTLLNSEMFCFLYNCGRGVVDQKARLLIRGDAQEENSEPFHTEDEVKDQEDEAEDGGSK